MYWRRRLKLDEERAEVQPEKPAFPPVRVVAPSLRDRFELRIDQRLAVVIPPAFDADELRRLVEVLRGC